MAPPSASASSSSISDQAFCLKLNSHQNHLVSAFQRLYNDEILTDCTISCQGGTLKAHKLVLSACSPYFTDLFAYFSNPNQYPIVILKDMSISDLEAIIEFMYKGEVTIPQSSLPSVLDSAKALMIIGLMDIKVETSPKDKESSPRGSYKRKRRQRTSIKQPQAEEISESDVSENDLCEDESHAKVSKGEEGDLVILQHEVLSKPSEIIIESASNEPQANVNSRLAEYPQVLNEADDSSCSLPGPSTRYPRPVCKLSPSAAFKANLRQMRIEKIQHSTGGLSGRKMWSEEETKTLVDVWDEESAGIWRSSSKKMISLQRISDILQQRNVDRDVSQVEGKIKALKRDFKAVKANKAIPSVQARMAPYLDKLESIFLREEL